MENRLLVIGIDALDYDMVHKFKDDLPNIQRIMSNGVSGRMNSVWPPDSETAWATIYTGWNPARHGIFRFVDQLDKTSAYLTSERENETLRGRTFWDIAGENGRRVCVLFPHIGYPVWEVNGVMVARAATKADIDVYPREIGSLLRKKDLVGIRGFPGKEKTDYLNRVEKLVWAQLEANLLLIAKEPWDLIFSYWSALDLIQHMFWNYSDPSDPTYPGPNRYENAIRDFYVLHDNVVGRLIECAGIDYDVMLISDHGHGQRPPRVFNVNRFLKEIGYLHTTRGSKRAATSIVKTLRGVSAKLVGSLELMALASKVLQSVPAVKKAMVTATGIDWSRTIAYSVDMSGIKAYNYGGIRVLEDNTGTNPELMDSIDHIISALKEIPHPDHEDRTLIDWIARKEDLYDGPYLDLYPEIVLELAPGFGLGADPNGPLIGNALVHSVYPGSHTRRNASFIYAGPGENKISELPSSITDITTTILDVLDLPQPGGLDDA